MSINVSASRSATTASSRWRRGLPRSFAKVEEVAQCCCLPQYFWEKTLDRPPGLTSEELPYNCFHRVFCNKVFRAITWMFTITLCGAVYSGWSQFSIILFRGDVYAWKCGDNWDFDTDGACDAQTHAVEALYPVAVASEFIVGAVAGMLFDHGGPRLCGFAGMSLLGLSIILLNASSQSLQLYLPAMIVMGSAGNLIAYPAFVLGDYFPSQKTLVVSAIMAFHIGAGEVAVLLLTLLDQWSYLSMQKLFWGYLFIIVVPCFVLYTLSLPCRRYVTTAVAGAGAAVAPASASASADSLGKVAHLRNNLDSVAGSFATQTTNRLATTAQPSSLRGTEIKPRVFAAATEVELPVATAEQRSHLFEKSVETPHLHNVSAVEHSSTMVSSRGSSLYSPYADAQSRPAKVDASGEGFVSISGDWQQFFREMRNLDIYLFAFVHGLSLLQFMYFPTTVYAEFGEQFSRRIGFVFPVEIVFALFLGAVAECLGSLYTSILMSGWMGVAFLLKLIDSPVIPYISWLLYYLGDGFVYTAKYVFVSETFQPHNFGKFGGFLCIAGGLATLIVIPISHDNRFRLWNYLFALDSAVCIVVLVWLVLLRHKRATAEKNLMNAFNSPASVESHLEP